MLLYTADVALDDSEGSIELQTVSTIYVGLSGFTILVWDHMITFADEVQYIWKGRKTPLVILFLINRYLTPLGFIVNLFAYMSPVWTEPMCGRFVKYEGAMTVVGINIVALMMLFRIYALYYDRRLVPVSILSFVLFVELAVNIWLVTRGKAVVRSQNIHACSMIFEPSVHSAASASAYLPLLYDTLVFAFTLNRTWRNPFLVRCRNKDEAVFGLGSFRYAGTVMRTIIQDGVLYYSVICSVTLVLTVMITAAPQGVQNIAAQLELILTVIMMSRITLSLRKRGRCTEGQNTPSLSSAISLKSVRFKVSKSQLERVRSEVVRDIEESFAEREDDDDEILDIRRTTVSEEEESLPTISHPEPTYGGRSARVSEAQKRPRALRFLSILEEEDYIPPEE